MTRKDYVLIAKAISDSRYNSTDIRYHQALNDVCLSMARAFEAENRAFDIAKFFSACEYGKLPRESEVA